jgi:hypothetical protein
MTYVRSGSLGQVKTATKTGSSEPDRTWQDVSAMTTAGGSIVSSIIGAATGQQQLPATQTPIFDTQPLPQEDATPNWLIPTVVIGGGVLVVALLAYSVKGKKVVANRRRRSSRRPVLSRNAKVTCTTCGKSSPSGSAFCQYCGRQIANAAIRVGNWECKRQSGSQEWDCRHVNTGEQALLRASIRRPTAADISNELRAMEDEADIEAEVAYQAQMRAAKKAASISPNRRRIRRNASLTDLQKGQLSAVRRAFANALEQHKIDATPTDIREAIRWSNGVKISTETGLLQDPYNVPGFQKVWNAAEKRLKKYGHPGYFDSINAGLWTAEFDVKANRRRRRARA